MKERTLIILKPDAINRTLVGEIVHRFESKGFKIVGMKMAHLTEDQLGNHYSHLKDKPFFPRIVKFMRSAPTLLIVLEGMKVVEVIRRMAGPTYGIEAAPGTIRGDYSLSMQNNVVHASESVDAAKKEIKRFFKPEELFDYERLDLVAMYSEEERGLV